MRLGDDDSSGVSSASSACVSEPRTQTTGAEPDSGFSVFGDRLDLFTEILQTQRQLHQNQQTTLEAYDVDSTPLCETTPASYEVTSAETPPSPDIRRPSPDIRHTRKPAPPVRRHETTPSPSIRRARTPPSFDVRSVPAAPPSDAHRATTSEPSENAVPSEDAPSEDVVQSEDGHSEITIGRPAGLGLVWGDQRDEEPESQWDRARAGVGESEEDDDTDPRLHGGLELFNRSDRLMSRDSDRQSRGSDRQLSIHSDRQLSIASDRQQLRHSDRQLSRGSDRHLERDGRTADRLSSEAYTTTSTAVTAPELPNGIRQLDIKLQLPETSPSHQQSAESSPSQHRSSPSLRQSAEAEKRSAEAEKHSEQLQQVLQWIDEKEAELRQLQLQPVTGNIPALQRQQEAAQKFLELLQSREASLQDAVRTPGSTIRWEQCTDASATADSQPVDQLWQRWNQLLEAAGRRSDELQSSLATMHVLERCMQDVERRLTELERDPESHTDDVTASTDDVTGPDRLLAVQRGLDDVNEQVARLTDNGAPLSSERLSRVASLASRLRQLSAASSGALSGCELARSVEPPWERAETSERAPYYLHHGERRTQWSHPQLARTITALAQLDNVRFSAYRTALKLRRLQRLLLLHRLPLEEADSVFQSEAWRLPCSGVAGVPDVLAVLTELYGRLRPPLSGGPALALRVDLCLNWLITVYDSRRTGSIPVYCLKLAIVALSQARLEDKYRYMFQLSSDPAGQLDARRLARLLRRLLQLPAQLSEAAAFGEDQVTGAVSSCLGGAEAVDEERLMEWMRAEPQTLVWLPVLHRVAGAEAARHQVRCNVCKEFPIVGFRYRCLQCFNWDMCQQCFFTGRVSKGHKLSHPLHEYCTESSSSDGLRDLAKSIRNRLKPKQNAGKPPKLAYLPVQPASEGDAGTVELVCAEELDDSLHAADGGGEHADPHNSSSVYSSPDSEEELQMITQYCLGLWPGGGDSSEGGGAASQEEHLRAVVRHLEQESRALQAEHRRLTGGEAPSEPPGGDDEPEDGDETLRARVQRLDRNNRRLGAQLSQLRRLMEGNGTNLARSSTLQTRAVTAAFLSSEGPQTPASPGGRLSRAKRLALSLTRRNGHHFEITA